jgi:hypothetical protein
LTEGNQTLSSESSNEDIIVFTHKSFKKLNDRVLKIFYYGGWAILLACVIYWVYFFFILQLYEPLLYTTYFTLILIALTCIKKFKSTFLNTFTSITFFGFLNMAVLLIPQSSNILDALTGPILHAAIGIFQLFLILNKRIPISKKFLFWGIIFYFTFMSSYDNFHRWSLMIGLMNLEGDVFMTVYSFYVLIFSVGGIYYYKKRYNVLQS